MHVSLFDVREPARLSQGFVSQVCFGVSPGYVSRLSPQVEKHKNEGQVSGYASPKSIVSQPYLKLSFPPKKKNTAPPGTLNNRILMVVSSG